MFDESGLDAAWKNGRARTPDEAVAFALDALGRAGEPGL